MTPRPSAGPYLARAVSSMWKRPASSSHQTHGSRQASSRVPSARVSYQRGSASSTIPCLVHVVRSGELARPTRCTRPSSAWQMLYTGGCHADAGLVQRVGRASSPDLTTWTKHGMVLEADPRWYETLADGTREEAWRDPWVWWDEGTA